MNDFLNRFSAAGKSRNVLIKKNSELIIYMKEMNFKWKFFNMFVVAILCYNQYAHDEK